MFHLARLRGDSFLSMLEPAKVFSKATFSRMMRFDQVSNLVKEYGFQLSLGDQVKACRLFPVNELLPFQDWWTLLSWHWPSLFKILPCKFNMQVAILDDHKRIVKI